MKILVLLSRFPYPLEKGDKLRAFHQIKQLSRQHRIILCCLSDQKISKDAIEKLEPYCEEIQIIRINKFSMFCSLVKGLFTPKPLQVCYFYHGFAQKRIELLIEKHLPKHIYCQLVRVSDYVKKYTVIPKTLDYMDALSMGVERRIATAPFYLKPVLKLEAQRLKHYEKSIFPFFQKHTIISSQDQKLIKHPEYEKIKVIPNGVDFNFFSPVNREKDYDLVFTGNMNYPPNIESACYIARELLPLVRRKYPDVKLLICGASPAPSVLRLQSKNITVTGWVEDIREAYARSRIFIAPMHIGTGLQNKLLEAMAMKIACITSELANNALGAIPGEHILVGKNKEEYLGHILSLLKDKDKNAQIAESGCGFVYEKFNWDKTTEELENWIGVE